MSELNARSSVSPVFYDQEHAITQPVELDRLKTALLIIDMQYHDASPDHGVNLALDRMYPGSCDYYNQRVEVLVIPTIQKLLDYFRRNHMQVFYVTVGSRFRDLRDMPTRYRYLFQRLERKSGVEDILWADNPGFQIRAEIAPQPGEPVIQKTTFGAFSGPQLDHALRERGVEVLVLTGVSTNCCIESTARGAVDRDFGTVIVDEGCADFDQDAHDASLRAFVTSFGRVLRTGYDVISAIESGQPV